MSLDTIIHSGLNGGQHQRNALVLMGGGARTAYQVGVLRALAALLREQRGPQASFPFQILVGTSAGALNAAYLASCATLGLNAFEQLANFWSELRSSHVYGLDLSRWARMNRWVAALSLAQKTRSRGAVLNTMPLVHTLHHNISLDGLELSLKSGVIDVLAVTASSYTTGGHWTFCHSAEDSPMQGWRRPGRRAEFQPITIEHLMASSAIPFLFPATPLWVDGQMEYFGDGSMRQMSPLSPAMHLGAQKVLVIGAGQPERSSMTGSGAKPSVKGPTLGGIAGHAMASVFHDTLQADVEQTQRVTQTLRKLPRERSDALPYRSVDVMSIQPTRSLDALALSQSIELPDLTRYALESFGVLKGGGGALASYLLFEPGFVQALMAMGESDAFARKAELLAFLEPA